MENRLDPIKFVDKRKGNEYWLYRCSCGTEKIIKKFLVQKDRTKSCGCLRAEQMRIIGKEGHPIHGKGGSLIYKRWHGMISRCRNINHASFHRYGGRGISVCDRWKNFQKFYEDMGDPPQKGLTIERINNDGNYEPSNCRWATRYEQAQNKSK